MSRFGRSRKKVVTYSRNPFFITSQLINVSLFMLVSVPNLNQPRWHLNIFLVVARVLCMRLIQREIGGNI